MNNSLTPLTDARQADSKVENQSIPDARWPWSAIDAGYDFARTMERHSDELRTALQAIVDCDCKLPFGLLSQARTALKNSST
jgi:hypothetical protein